jgi:hypothetical protein
MAHVAAVPHMVAVCVFWSCVLGMCPLEEWSVVGAAGRVEVCARLTTLKIACGVVLSCAAGVCMLVSVLWFLLCPWAAGAYGVRGLSWACGTFDSRCGGRVMCGPGAPGALCVAWVL